MNSYFQILGSCCKKLVLALFGNANSTQGHRAGEFEIVEEKLNGRDQWLRKDGNMAIWFNDQENRWTIGSSVGSGGGIFADSSFECPSDVGDNWQYYNGSSTFQDAQGEIRTLCLG